MKFQNSSIHGFKVMLCIKKRDERTDGRTDNPEAICPSNFFEVGGIKTNCKGVRCPLMYVCMVPQVRTYVYLFVCLSVFFSDCMYVCLHTCIYVCLSS